MKRGLGSWTWTGVSACLIGFAFPAEARAQRCAFVARPDGIAIVNLEVEGFSRRIALGFEPLDMALGADGRTLFIARYGTPQTATGPATIAAAVDLLTGTVTDIIDRCEVAEVSGLCGTSAIAVTPDGRTALAVGYDTSCSCTIGETARPGEGCDVGEHRISTIDTQTLQVRRFQTLGFGRIFGGFSGLPCRPGRTRTEVAISPDGDNALITDGRNDRGARIAGAMKLRRLDVPSERARLAGSCAECEPRLYQPGPVAFSDSPGVAFIGNTFDTPARTIVPVQLVDGAVGAPVAELDFVPSLLAAAPGSRLVAASPPRPSSSAPAPAIAFIDAEAAPVIAPLPADASDVAVSADGRTAYVSVAGSAGAALLAFAIDTASLRATIPIDATPSGGALAIGTAPDACFAPGPCVGDCNDDGEIALGEVQTGFLLFLGTRLLDDCPAFDSNFDRDVSLGEVQQSFLGFLAGCTPE